MKVEAITRSLQGTGASRRLRREGKVPGIVYGGGAQPVNVELDHNTMFHAMRKESFHASVLDLELDGQPAGQVLLRDYQLHPFKQIVMHMDFQRINANEKLTKKVPLHFFGQENSPAVKFAHNIVSHVLNEIELRCLPKDLPEFLEVDLSTLEAVGTVHASQIKLPAGVELVLHPGEDPVIATATAPRVSAADEAADAAEAQAAAAASAASTPAAKGDAAAGGTAKK